LFCIHLAKTTNVEAFKDSGSATDRLLQANSRLYQKQQVTRKAKSTSAAVLRQLGLNVTEEELSKVVDSITNDNTFSDNEDEQDFL
jgi:hypothetical protein